MPVPESVMPRENMNEPCFVQKPKFRVWLPWKSNSSGGGKKVVLWSIVVVAVIAAGGAGYFFVYPLLFPAPVATTPLLQ